MVARRVCYLHYVLTRLWVALQRNRLPVRISNGSYSGRPMVRPQTQDYWSRPVQWTIGPDRFDDFLNGPRPV